MYSREESAKIREEFWVSYGKSFPRKWVLYNTKIKNFGFKFIANRKLAEVTLDIECVDPVQRELMYDQLFALKNILQDDYLPDVVYDKYFFLENGKLISRVSVVHAKEFSIHNKDSWLDCFTFFNKTMHQFELFWHEYEDFIRQAVI